MRVVLLNTHWTVSRRLDEWLARTDWDVAVLLEVSRRAGLRLAGERPHWQMSSSMERVTRWPAYPVVILGRRVGAFSPVALPQTFGIRDGCYDERIHALSFDWDGRACTVVGLHTPNAATRGQADKEEVYRQFAEWVAPLAAAGPLIAALDTNNGCWRLSPDADRADMVHQHRFLRQPETANLREAYFASTTGRLRSRPLGGATSTTGCSSPKTCGPPASPATSSPSGARKATEPDSSPTTPPSRLTSSSPGRR